MRGGGRPILESIARTTFDGPARLEVMSVPAGREIKVYDKRRKPRNWNELLSESQCAVFFRRVDSEIPTTSEGLPVAKFRDCSFFLFDRLNEAREFCETKVREHPELCGEIYDSTGKARSPLFTIVHPNARAKDELSPSSLRKRRILAVALFLGAIPMIWWDWRAGGILILPTFLGINMLFVGLRLFQWHWFGQERLKEEQARVVAHLEKEKNEEGREPA